MLTRIQIIPETADFSAKGCLLIATRAFIEEWCLDDEVAALHGVECFEFNTVIHDKIMDGQKR